jgi:hypothetical protein
MMLSEALRRPVFLQGRNSQTKAFTTSIPLAVIVFPRLG